MKEYLKEYKVRLHTIGPVFVGSGKELSKKEYIFLKDSIGVIDMAKMLSLMTKRKLDQEFENFFMNDTKSDLYHWLLDHRMKPEDIGSCMRYTINRGDTALQRGTRTQIMECMKDPYGYPYIPGSSIKGMLRTILLGYELIRNSERYENVRSGLLRNLDQRKSRNSYMLRESREIEQEILYILDRNEKRRSDAVNDVLSGVRISDSEPLSMDQMVICQKLEHHLNGEEKPLNLLRECVRPGVDICFTLTVDETLAPYDRKNDLYPITPEKIMTAVAAFANSYNECFLQLFDGTAKPSSDTVYLGGGAGFVSKTFLYPMLGHQKGVEATAKVFDMTGVTYKHKHNLDKGLNVSPHILKVTKYKGRVYQMGECRLEFLPR